MIDDITVTSPTPTLCGDYKELSIFARPQRPKGSVFWCFNYRSTDNSLTCFIIYLYLSYGLFGRGCPTRVGCASKTSVVDAAPVTTRPRGRHYLDRLATALDVRWSSDVWPESPQVDTFVRRPHLPIRTLDTSAVVRLRNNARCRRTTIVTPRMAYKFGSTCQFLTQ